MTKINWSSGFKKDNYNKKNLTNNKKNNNKLLLIYEDLST